METYQANAEAKKIKTNYRKEAKEKGWEIQISRSKCSLIVESKFSKMKLDGSFASGYLFMDTLHVSNKWVYQNAEETLQSNEEVYQWMVQYWQEIGRSLGLKGMFLYHPMHGKTSETLLQKGFEFVMKLFTPEEIMDIRNFMPRNIMQLVAQSHHLTYLYGDFGRDGLKEDFLLIQKAHGFFTKRAEDEGTFAFKTHILPDHTRFLFYKDGIQSDVFLKPEASGMILHMNDEAIFVTKDSLEEELLKRMEKIRKERALKNLFEPPTFHFDSLLKSDADLNELFFYRDKYLRNALWDQLIHHATPAEIEEICALMNKKIGRLPLCIDESARHVTCFLFEIGKFFITGKHPRAVMEKGEVFVFLSGKEAHENYITLCLEAKREELQKKIEKTFQKDES